MSIAKRREFCPAGHSYAEHGHWHARAISGYMTCRVCRREQYARALKKRKARKGQAPSTDPNVLLCRETLAQVLEKRAERKAAVSAEVQRMIAYPWTFRECLGYMAPREDGWAE